MTTNTNWQKIHEVWTEISSIAQQAIDAGKDENWEQFSSLLKELNDKTKEMPPSF